MQIYTQEVKNNVRLLRLAGLSLNQIQKTTKVPRTTIRGWIKDIILSSEQQEALKLKVAKVLQEGRIKAEKMRKEKRLEKEKEFMNKGIRDVGKLTKRELLIAGISLYWAEGFKNKHERRLGFCNSDPHMIKFYLEWLRKALEINKKSITLRLTLNIHHKPKTEDIQKYWSKTTRIPLSQFTKPFYQNTQWKKSFSDNNYYGVLRIHVRESLDYLLKMRGWIEGLKSNIDNLKI